MSAEKKENISTQKESSNDHILATFEAKVGESTVGHIANGLGINEKYLSKEIFGNKVSTGVFQKEKTKIVPLEKGFFFSEPRINDLYSLNVNSKGEHEFHIIRNGRDIFILIPSEKLLPKLPKIKNQLTELSIELKPDIQSA